MAIRYWCVGMPSVDGVNGVPADEGHKCIVTVVEYDTEETGAGPFPDDDATGRTFTEAYDCEKETLLDLRDRLRVQRDNADGLRGTAADIRAEVNDWLTDNDL